MTPGSATGSAAALETIRLRLEPLSYAHADALYSIYRQPAVRLHLITRPGSRADFDDVLRRAVAFGESHGMWALVDKATSLTIGRVGFFAFGTCARPELAFLLAQEFWGRGLATEASTECLRHGFAHRGWNEVIAVTRPSNLAALRVLAKLGMRQDQTLELGGAPVVIYEIRRAAFEAAT